MTRDLKVLRLALVVVFAMSAVAASAASAQNGILTSDGPMTLKGVNSGTGLDTSTTWFGLTVTCPNAFYTGHRVDVTPHEKIPNNSSAVTITPHYGVCRIGETIKETIDMNGCDYLLHLTKTTAVADQYAITTTINCPPGGHIVLTMFTNEHFHLATKKSFCHITITEKPSYDGLVVKDTTNNTLDLTGTIEGFEAHKAVIPGTTGEDSGIFCSSETTTTGVFHMDTAITEINGTPIKISHL